MAKKPKKAAAPADGRPLTLDDISEDREDINQFLKARRQMIDSWDDKNETNFWVCLVFQNWKQKKQFLDQLEGVGVLYGMYANGEDFAEAVGLPVTRSDAKAMSCPISRRLVEMSMDYPKDGAVAMDLGEDGSEKKRRRVIKKGRKRRRRPIKNLKSTLRNGDK